MEMEASGAPAKTSSYTKSANWKYYLYSCTIESYFSNLLFNTRLTGPISVSELKYVVIITAAKSVIAFRVISMAVNLSRLTTGTMNSNTGYDKT